MDRPPLREGGVVRLWTSRLEGEVFYQADLPVCCLREARGSDGELECLSCGALWQSVEAPEPEECGFVAEEKEQRDAAA